MPAVLNHPVLALEACINNYPSSWKAWPAWTTAAAPPIVCAFNLACRAGSNAWRYDCRRPAASRMAGCTWRPLGILRGLNCRGTRSMGLYSEFGLRGAPTPISRRSCATVFMPTQPPPVPVHPHQVQSSATAAVELKWISCTCAATWHPEGPFPTLGANSNLGSAHSFSLTT